MTTDPVQVDPQDTAQELDSEHASDDVSGRADDGTALDMVRAEEGAQELSTKALRAVDILAGLFERMGFDASVERVVDGDRIEIELGGADAGRVIGKKGLTLDALQFVVNKVVNRFPEGRRHVVLDVEGYKDRRDDSLRDMAHRLAEKASRTGKVISVSPMPSRERRVIHLALAEFSGVTTRSDGEGSERRVRIIPASRSRRRSASK